MTKRDWILCHLENDRLSHALNPSELTVGVELELFLLTHRGTAPRHDQARSLIARIADATGWTLPEGDDMLARATRNGSIVEIKFDHPPHLLEVTAGPCDDLFALVDALSWVIDTVERSAELDGLSLLWQDVLPFTAPLAEGDFYAGLRWTRRAARARQRLPDDPVIENYAAGIAALQLHVGGLDWVRRSAWVERLYNWEPALLAALHAAPQTLQHRWSGYCEAFPGNPLIGFPDMPRWTLRDWADALMRTPILALYGDVRAGTTLDHFGPIDWSEFRFKVRDLQIIRPRDFGTLEFRADPTPSSVTKLRRRLALRLGLCGALFLDDGERGDFKSSRIEWWRIARGGKSSLDLRRLLATAYAGLAARGRGEEMLLVPSHG